MANHVFIPSRGRWIGARKLADAWHQQDFEVTFVVEKDEATQYASRVEDCRVDPLPVRNAGIGFSRNHCVDLAASYGYESIILADDDIKPGKHMDWLIEDAEDPKILGITARYSYHDFALGPKIKDMSDLILMPTGLFRLVALNVMNVENLGNYDHTLEYAEDCDLFLRGLREGFPWMTHLGTWSMSIGKRYEPGGMLDYAGGEENLAIKKGQWHRTLHDQYPSIVNKHTERCAGKQNCIRVGWQRAYDKYMPGWREYSAIHGGDIEKYFSE
jgi:hypothetical protein